MITDDEALALKVRSALKLVIDPELGQNVVDLGMIYDVLVTDGCIATIRMTTTTRGCPATGFIRQAVEDRAWSVEGIEYVDVKLTYDPPWSPALIASEIAGLLGH
ncbi:metal-sulfur cluster assembly factor [Devosia psychrophila]|jgi:metal-sulfur cluster biosynthetic enzyme|uniref:Aromatic ring hydroxylase n=1 Tax=Devosia psychrophila TaxID=728005 RepID=A0A0F5PRL4_9HYPH|nr:metal-sulfur cluster assembly factor [Devosia psychrophila]KKC31322.1 aromatic ring hydroxylase [Devosia psychrophila]SFC90139.1 Metal-sulfur cluster biosynthetic enzyme [Devosia psychrophila]